MMTVDKTTVTVSSGDILPVNVHTKESSISKRAFGHHRHKEFEISLFKKGTGLYKTMDSVYDIAEGDIFLFSTDEIHCLTEIYTPMSIMNIKLEPRLMWADTSGLLGATYLRIFLNSDHERQNRLDRNNPHIDEIRSLIIEMEKEYAQRQSEYEHMIKAQLLMLLVKIKRYFFSSEEDDFYIKKDSFIPLEKAMDYIDAHYFESLTLSEIASVSKMSPNYFCSVFKKLNGLSTWDYITIKRIEKAKKILRSHSDDTMLSIAKKCGFSSTAGFNKAFKQCTGFTPTDFVKNLK